MLVVRNVRLWDGTGARIQENMALVIEESRVASVGRTSEIGTPEGAEEIDGRAMTLMPGLIDCHDHINSFGYGLAEKWGLTEPASTRHMRVAATLKQTLESGYTTLRDAGGLDAGFRMAVEQGLVPGPPIAGCTVGHNASGWTGRASQSVRSSPSRTARPLPAGRSGERPGGNAG